METRIEQLERAVAIAADELTCWVNDAFKLLEDAKRLNSFSCLPSNLSNRCCEIAAANMRHEMFKGLLQEEKNRLAFVA